MDVSNIITDTTSRRCRKPSARMVASASSEITLNNSDSEEEADEGEPANESIATNATAEDAGTTTTVNIFAGETSKKTALRTIDSESEASSEEEANDEDDESEYEAESD